MHLYKTTEASAEDGTSGKLLAKFSKEIWQRIQNIQKVANEHEAMLAGQ